MMHTNNKKSSRKRNITIFIAVTIFIVALVVVAGNFMLRSQRDRANETRPASLVLSCSVETPEEDLPKSVKEGDTGSCIVSIRELLEVHGITADTPVSVESVFDEQLTALVKRFQADSSLRQDGVVGEQTWSALRNTSMVREEPSESPTPTESEDSSMSPSPKESASPSISSVPIPEVSPGPSEYFTRIPEVTPSPTPRVVDPMPTPTMKPRQPKPLPSVPPVSEKQPAFEIDGDSYNRFTGPNTTNSVVLTYDDCPDSYSSFITTIQAAKKMGVSLVLAPTATCVKEGKFNVGEARNMGHAVINHSIDHYSYLDMSSEEITLELHHKVFESNFARPPYGAGGFNEAESKKVVNAFTEMNMRMWLWSNDTEDWGGKVDGKSQKPKTTAAIVKHIKQTAEPGDTILMHMQHNGFNPKAVGEIVDTLEGKGLTACKNSNKPMPQYPTASSICR